MPNLKSQWAFYSEYGRRLLILRRILLTSELQWNCYIALMQDKRSISEASMACHLNAPRITVRAVVVQGVEYGLIERTSEGLALTATGLAAIVAIHSDTYEIALGLRQGYSSASIEVVKALPNNSHRRARLERMKQIGFYPTIRPPVAKKVV